MFQSPGSRSHVGSDGQEKFKNQVTVGSNVGLNTSTLLIGNSFGGSVISSGFPAIQIANSTSQTIIQTNSLTIGNSTANSLFNATSLAIVNATANSTLTPGSLSNINATANTTVGIGTLTLAGAGSNTGLVIGTSVKAANGYTFLPNGILLQWMSVSATSTTTRFTYPITFPTTLFNVSATAGANLTYAANHMPQILAANTSGANIATANSTATQVYVMAIGN